MTPGERCDEIMRLIDETLEDYASSNSTAGATVTMAPPLAAALRTLARADSARLAKTA